MFYLVLCSGYVMDKDPWHEGMQLFHMSLVANVSSHKLTSHMEPLFQD
jgi:hypothetical protein